MRALASQTPAAGTTAGARHAFHCQGCRSLQAPAHLQRCQRFTGAVRCNPDDVLGQPLHCGQVQQQRGCHRQATAICSQGMKCTSGPVRVLGHDVLKTTGWYRIAGQDFLAAAWACLCRRARTAAPEATEMPLSMLLVATPAVLASSLSSPSPYPPCVPGVTSTSASLPSPRGLCRTLCTSLHPGSACRLQAGIPRRRSVASERAAGVHEALQALTACDTMR